ncbi:MAG: hypothetical protein ACJARW_001559 [Methylophilaceae bacterium]|jgi:hypothetical protein|tara:strand:- start:5492 stop:5722 length:231 start_codon:yes stop_codon:yes gene_type:complete
MLEQALYSLICVTSLPTIPLIAFDQQITNQYGQTRLILRCNAMGENNNMITPHVFALLRLIARTNARLTKTGVTRL